MALLSVLLEVSEEVVRRRRANEDVLMHRVLPAELLVEIFELCISRDVNDDGWDLRSLILVSHVCAFWRGVVLQEARLWAWVPSASQRLTKKALARSRDAPLHLSLPFSFWTQQNRSSSVVSLIRKARRRTAFLEIEVDVDQKRLKDIILVFESAAASLEVLKITALSDEGIRNVKCQLIKHELPVLRHFSCIGDMGILHGHSEIVGQLTKLFLDGSRGNPPTPVDTTALAHLLCGAVHLSELRLYLPDQAADQSSHDAGSPGKHRQAAVSPIILTSLVCFVLEGIISHIRFFLQNIRAANLKVLHIRASGVETFRDSQELFNLASLKSFLDVHVGILPSAAVISDIWFDYHKCLTHRRYMLAAFDSARPQLDTQRAHLLEIDDGKSDPKGHWPRVPPAARLAVCLILTPSIPAILEDESAAERAHKAVYLLGIVHRLGVTALALEFPVTHMQTLLWPWTHPYMMRITARAAREQRGEYLRQQKEYLDVHYRTHVCVCALSADAASFLEALTALEPSVPEDCEDASRGVVSRQEANDIIMPRLAFLRIVGLEWARAQQAEESPTLREQLSECLRIRAAAGLAPPHVVLEDGAYFPEDAAQKLVSEGRANGIIILGIDGADVEDDGESYLTASDNSESGDTSSVTSSSDDPDPDPEVEFASRFLVYDEMASEDEDDGGSWREESSEEDSMST